MKTMHVLGLAPEIKYYKPVKGIERIGVNNICDYKYVDYLLIVDPLESFHPDRLATIVTCRPKKFYSSQSKFSFMPNFEPLFLSEKGGDVTTIDNWYLLPRHVDSTFTACCIAYHLGAKRIELYGVSFFNHHLMAYEEQILIAYNRLKDALLKRGVVLVSCTKNSLLNKVLCYESKKEAV